MKQNLIRNSHWPRALVVIALAAGLGFGGLAGAAPETMNAPKVTGTEEAWIIGDVSRDQGQLLGFAQAQENRGNTSGPPPTITLQPQTGGVAGAYTVQVQPAKGTAFAQDFTVSGSPWEPGAYLPWAKSLAEAWGVHPQAAPADAMPDEKLIALLDEPTIEIFLSANATLSAALTKTPGSAGLHEQAALLLAALAWSETGGGYSDPREFLNSACAHLTMAELLRGQTPAGAAGRMAELTLLVMTGRQADADVKLDALAATANVPQATEDWVAALRLANYEDWRKYKPGKDASLLWRRAYVLALMMNVNAEAGMNFYNGMTNQDGPDWTRLGMGWSFSADQGRAFLTAGLQNEEAEINQIMVTLGLGEGRNPNADPNAETTIMAQLGLDMVHDTDAKPDARVEKTTRFLNETHQGPWQGSGLAVVSLGQWGSRAQRNLLQMLTDIHYHYQAVLGRPDEAERFRQQEMDSWISSLRMGPFLSFSLAQNQAQYDAAMDAIGPLMVAHPEWVIAENWSLYNTAPENIKLEYRPVVPNYGDWFKPVLPHGTTFDAINRVDFAKNVTVELAQEWSDLSPHMDNIQLALLRAQAGEKPTPEAIRAAVGPELDYDMSEALALANVSLDDMTVYQQAMKAACDIDPDYYLALGDTLLEHGMEEPAVAAYQKAVDLAKNREWVANDMDFLASYYYDHGKKDEALKIAKIAADQHTQFGWMTLARQYVRQGNFTEALQAAQASDELGNDDTGARVLVYNAWANATSDVKVKRQATKLWNALFPRCKQNMKLADLAQASAPTDGVVLQKDTIHTKNAGLKIGDKIVAVNGWQVHNQKEALSALYLGMSFDYPVIFWRDGKYQETTVHLPQRHQGVDVKNFRVKGGT